MKIMEKDEGDCMSVEYEKCTDEELIDRLRDGESDITDYLMDKYKNLVKSKAKAMFILGADNEDLIQEGMIGLFKAVRDYDSGRDASFQTFAQLCISRQMYTAVQASGRKKHAPLNYYISLYAEKLDTDGKEIAGDLLENIPSESAQGRNPEEMLIDKENERDLEVAVESELSPFEKQVLDLCLIGMSYTEIAKVLGREQKATDNAIQRIKGKIRKIIQRKQAS